MTAHQQRPGPGDAPWQGIALYGAVADGEPRNAALLYQASKIRLRPDLETCPPYLVVAVEEAAPPGTAEQPEAVREALLSFTVTHLEYAIENPGGLPPCGAAESYVPSRWLSLVTPVPISIDPLKGRPGIDPVAVPIPLRILPAPPRFVSQGFNGEFPDSAGGDTLSSARQWAYEVVYESVMEAKDELQLEVDWNISAVAARSLAAAGGGDLFEDLIRFQARYPAADTYLSLLQQPDTTQATKWSLLAAIASDLATIAGDFSLRPAAALRAPAAHQPVRLFLRETPSPSPTPTQTTMPESSALRDCTVTWQPADVPVDVTVFPPKEATVPDATGQKVFLLKDDPGKTTIGTSLKDDSWRRRRVTLHGLDVLAIENAMVRGRLVRNQYLAPDGAPEHDRHWKVSDPFVYATQWSAVSDPLFPQILVNRPITIGNVPDDLSKHLDLLLRPMLTPPTATDVRSRRMRLEIRYGFGAAVGAGLEGGQDWKGELPISSPQQLLPPTDVTVAAAPVAAAAIGPLPVPVADLVQRLTADLANWNSAYMPDSSGRLVFDLVIYSSLSPDASTQDQPLLQMRLLQLPLAVIRSWG